VDGNPVTGNPMAGIGGPTLFFGSAQGATFRADITGLGLVTDGMNSLAVDGLDCDKASNGAGLFVIYDDGVSPIPEIQVRDGNDLAVSTGSNPVDTTVAQSLIFRSVQSTARRTSSCSSIALLTTGIVRV